jgi:hypothetical protein
MIVELLGVSIEQDWLNLMGLAGVLGAVMLMLSRAMHSTNRRGGAPDTLMIAPVALRISRRARRSSSCASHGFPPDLPSRAPTTLLRSARLLRNDGRRSQE